MDQQEISVEFLSDRKLEKLGWKIESIGDLRTGQIYRLLRFNGETVQDTYFVLITDPYPSEEGRAIVVVHYPNLRFGKRILLADLGLEPDSSGRWNENNWVEWTEILPLDPQLQREARSFSPKEVEMIINEMIWNGSGENPFYEI